MRLFVVILFFCLLVSCAGYKSEQQTGKSLYNVLEAAFCPNTSDFRGIGIGTSENEALVQARSNMALKHFSQKIESRIQITSQNINEIATTAAKISIDQQAALLNPQDARSHFSARHGNEIGVVACMSKADFEVFCGKKIEASFDEARKNLGFSKQLMEADRKKDAFEKLGDSKQNIDSLVQYKGLLLAMGFKGNSESIQDEQINELLKDIISTQIEIESGMFVFIAGTESIQNQKVDIIIPKLQTMLSENNVAITEKQEEASHILNIEAKVCNQRSDEHFHYASACVKITFTNVKTGKNEITITVNGRKEGGLNEYNAGERAFRFAVNEIWVKIKDKILKASL